jgi:hypothetical protein
VRGAIPVLVALILIGGASCGGEELASSWRERDISIDGDLADWDGALTYFDDHDVTLGLMNDETHLYIAMASDDRVRLMQVLGAGLTLWFDPEGGKEKTFGVRFPVGAAGTGPPPMAGGQRHDDEEQMRAMLEERLAELEVADLEILESIDATPIALSRAEASGIEVQLGWQGGALAYELAVPLNWGLGHPYAIGVPAGETVGVGLETAEIDRQAMGERRRGQRGGGGGMGPPGGGMGGRGGGMGGRGGPPPGMEMPEPLDVWLEVVTAAPPVDTAGALQAQGGSR